MSFVRLFVIPCRHRSGLTADDASGRGRSRRAGGLAFVLLTLPLLAPSDPVLTRITFDGIDVQRPSWSPDGKMLAFSRHEAGGTHIWQYILDMTSAPPSSHRLTKRPTPDHNGVFSPNGKEILLSIIPQSGTQGNVDVAIIAVDGSGLATVVGDHDGRLVVA